MSWNDVLAAMADGNIQNHNAANAGDGPKHIALLHAMRLMGQPLQQVIETHAGGGVYRVSSASFCLNAPAGSILAQHQRAAALPPAAQGHAHYSASGDQILGTMPAACTYAAFDQNPRTRQRLAAMARYRGREELLRSFGDFRGGGMSVAETLLESNPQRTLLMVDPFDLADWTTAAPLIPPRYSSIWFAALPCALAAQPPLCWLWPAEAARPRILWRWQGNATPGRMGRYSFALLALMATDDATVSLHQQLRREHELMMAAMAGPYGYAGTVGLL